MLKRYYLTGVLALLSLAAGSAAASAAETGTKTMPDSSIQAVAYRYPAHGQFNGYRGLYDYAGPPAGYGYYYGNPGYEYRWDPNTWNIGNGYY